MSTTLEWWTFVQRSKKGGSCSFSPRGFLLSVPAVCEGTSAHRSFPCFFGFFSHQKWVCREQVTALLPCLEHGIYAVTHILSLGVARKCVKKMHLSNTSVDFSEQVAQDAHLSFLKKVLCCSQHCYQSSGTNKRVAHLQGAFPPISSQLTKKPMLFKSKTGWQIHACALLCSCLSLLLQSCLKNDGIIIYFLAQTI